MPRQAKASLNFNGKNVDTTLAQYLQSVTYKDVAAGSSDEIKIELQNIDMKWTGAWFPVKGDNITGKLVFKSWNSEGQDLTLDVGKHILDDIQMRGGPMEASFGGLAIPASESFKSQMRTKTWKNTYIKKLASTICRRYKLKLIYDAKTCKIKTLEQSEKADSAFLYDLTKKYGFGMKVFGGKIVIYDKGRYEAKSPVATLTRKSFIGDSWTYNDTLDGSYTGAKISYKIKSSSKKKTTKKKAPARPMAMAAPDPAPTLTAASAAPIMRAKKKTKKKKATTKTLFVGFKKENSPGSRTYKVSEQADNAAEARLIAAAKVNEANEQITTLSGNIWPNPNIVAAATVKVSGMGKIDGKYFVDSSTTSVSGSGGASQHIEMHKCQKRIASTVTATTKKSTGKKKTTKKKTTKKK